VAPSDSRSAVWRCAFSSDERSRLRILIASDVFFPRVNGVSTSIRLFADELTARGHRVAIVAPAYEETVDHDGAAVVERAPGYGVPLDPEDRYVPPARLVAAGERAAGRLGDVDLIHVQTPFSAFLAARRLARRWAVPLVATHHTHFAAYGRHYVRFLPARWLDRSARRLARAQSRSLDALIVPTQPMADEVAHYDLRCPVRVIPTGLDLEAFRRSDRAAGRKLLGLDDATPVVLYVGRLAREKDLERVVRVFARVLHDMPSARAVLAGEGPARAEAEAQCRALGISGRVSFLGYLDRRRSLPDLYAAADVLVSASTTETQGLVILEAMACGLPVVGVAALGTRSILDAALGAVGTRGDDDELSSACLDLLRDPPRHAAMREQARRVAGAWTIAAATETLEGLYRDVLHGRAASDAESV
jgi:glycosyltransferase involved in cell wall biosynthesis